MASLESTLSVMPSSFLLRPISAFDYGEIELEDGTMVPSTTLLTIVGRSEKECNIDEKE